DPRAVVRGDDGVYPARLTCPLHADGSIRSVRGLRRPQTTIDASSVFDLSAPMCYTGNVADMSPTCRQDMTFRRDWRRQGGCRRHSGGCRVSAAVGKPRTYVIDTVERVKAHTVVMKKRSPGKFIDQDSESESGIIRSAMRWRCG
ncbi:hypothetical protein THAOC_14828, partial [Thalassiosira oceanica]